MASDWVKLKEESLSHRLQIIKDFLEDNEINAVIVDKIDSVYKLGSYQVYVERDSVIRAKKLIEDNLKF